LTAADSGWDFGWWFETLPKLPFRVRLPATSGLGLVSSLTNGPRIAWILPSSSTAYTEKPMTLFIISSNTSVAG